MKNRRTAIWVLAGIASLAVAALLGWSLTTSGRAEEGPPILQYPSFPPTPTIGPAPTTPLKPASASLASSSFDSANALASWQIVDPPDAQPEQHSNWVVQNGALEQDGIGQLHDPAPQDAMLVTGDPKWTDYTIQTKFYDVQNGLFGLVARRQGNSFYRYRILADRIDGTPKQVLEKVVNGVATPLATHDSPGYKARAWHTAAMTVSGQQIRVTIDGKVMAEATDASLTSGQAGLYTQAIGGIRFDDVNVTTP